ncbi:hypothetical protein CY34DRAFT_186826 [Suillus luteus UH-Slu-Lm8-n1]|uniref:Secreted protein n=1 Tax=Suillus luteus UH-Slu-Lm8-n1 TaxID=930992 RepID=A0A0D0AV02_9AGAM|nr:hypothetical protein CY34DRAFT_186826 [Suillus luteus UH-Slu-Lm8-n1]
MIYWFLVILLPLSTSAVICSMNCRYARCSNRCGHTPGTELTTGGNFGSCIACPIAHCVLYLPVLKPDISANEHPRSSRHFTVNIID